MIIGIDGNEANIERRVGVNVYAFKLLHELQKLVSEPHKNSDKSEFVAPRYKSGCNLIVYLKNKPLSDLPKESKNFKYKIISGGGLWMITKLTPYLFKNPEKIEILFSPSHYTTPFLTIPKVCSIMDLGYLENSGQFKKITFWQLKYWTAISVFASKRVLSISNATKNDIVRHYKFASNKISVVPLSHDIDIKKNKVTDNDVRRIKNKYSIVSDYILYMGTLKPSKNIDGIIRAFSLITKHYPQIVLVIAGKKGWMYEYLFDLVKELKLENKVIFTDFIPDEDKNPLRKGSKVFVMPSHWEGFGIDALSCMALGVPTIVSNAGSLPEVVGSAGIVVDKDNPKSIADGIEKVLKMNKNEYNKLVEKGKAQARKFSWQKTAQKTLDILENINV